MVFMKDKIKKIVQNFKGKKCIIAGIHHPNTFGFTKSTLNAI